MLKINLNNCNFFQQFVNVEGSLDNICGGRGHREENLPVTTSEAELTAEAESTPEAPGSPKAKPGHVSGIVNTIEEKLKPAATPALAKQKSQKKPAKQASKKGGK